MCKRICECRAEFANVKPNHISECEKIYIQIYIQICKSTDICKCVDKSVNAHYWMESLSVFFSRRWKYGQCIGILCGDLSVSLRWMYSLHIPSRWSHPVFVTLIKPLFASPPWYLPPLKFFVLPQRSRYSFTHLQFRLRTH